METEIDYSSLPIRVRHVSIREIWAMMTLHACTHKLFLDAPNEIVVEGVNMRKESYHYDGILYINRDPEARFGQPSVFSQITEWTGAIFPRAQPEGIAERLLEEARELLDAVRVLQSRNIEVYQQHGHTGPYEARKSVESEIGDIRSLLSDLCLKLAIDEDKAALDKLRVNKARKWNITDQGTGYHIKEDL